MIDKKTIERMAYLARLKLSDSQISEYAVQMTTVLKNFEQISKVDTQGVEPLVTPSEIEIFWREDKAIAEFTAAEMTANAPLKTGNLFKVPPVV